MQILRVGNIETATLRTLKVDKLNTIIKMKSKIFSSAESIVKDSKSRQKTTLGIINHFFVLAVCLCSLFSVAQSGVVGTTISGKKYDVSTMAVATDNLYGEPIIAGKGKKNDFATVSGGNPIVDPSKKKIDLKTSFTYPTYGGGNGTATGKKLDIESIISCSNTGGGGGTMVGGNKKKDDHSGGLTNGTAGSKKQDVATAAYTFRNRFTPKVAMNGI